MRRYIDIDSARRNRISYPLIGNFVLNVNSNIKNTPVSAEDPVVLAFPYETNQLSGGSTPTQLALSVTSSNVVNFYRDSYLEIFGNFRRIISYDQTVQIATVSPAFGVAYPALTPYTIRKQLPVELAAGGTYQEALPVNTAANVFTPGPLASVIAGANGLGLQDLYVFVAGATPPLTYQWGRLERILAAGVWTGNYKVITNSGQQYGPLLAGTIYEIQRFSFDNVVPLRYNGTENMNNAVCEQLRLVNLVVPNNKVNGGYGGTLQNYPHLYVSVYSEKGITYNGPIISNNPTTNRALFKVPISFLPNTTWLTLSLSAINQQVAFRENDALHITVFLPNGDILDFEPFNSYTFFQGYNFPIESDPFTQLHMVVEVTR
jgi:hypothetical protein